MSTIAKIKDKINIADGLAVLGVDIPRKSRPYKIQCIFPDHNDKTPSMMVYPHSDRVWCYGCNRGGDLLDCTQILAGMSFKDAYGLWKDKTGADSMDVYEIEDVRRRRELRALCEYAADESYKMEQGLPKPQDTGSLPLWDRVYEQKDWLDNRYRDRDDKAGMMKYLRELREWYDWAWTIVGGENDVSR